jgi:hypothetical protein
LELWIGSEGVEGRNEGQGVDKTGSVCIIVGLNRAECPTLFNKSIKIICVGACGDC